MSSSHLFSPFTLAGLRLPNRIMVSPMCQYSAADGSATTWHHEHLVQMAQSRAGLLMLEATAVQREGRITPGCLGLYSDENEQALARVLQAVRPHMQGAIGIQLGHAGRKASSQPPWKGGMLIASTDQDAWQPLAPSALPHRPDEPAPLAMSLADIAATVQAFVQATQRASRLELDLIELHAAHGYLLHQFLSPVSNQRTDAYGGSLQGRMRLPLEIFEAVRAQWPAHKPLGVRVSATEWLEHTGQPSWCLPDTLAFAQELKARGCSFIDVSSGGISPQQRIELKPGYQVHLAQAVRQATGLPTVAVGLITEPQQAEDLLAQGQADLVALGRSLLWNPRWPWHAAAVLGAGVMPPPQYGRAAPREHTQVFAGLPFGMR